ncbi:MAG: RND transporter [Legionella sp.]|nr:MAG: RND transporter [Legionella sp.]
MWLVRIALSRPYTFIVLALMLLIIGIMSIIRTPTDIFPSINIPIISVVWTYNGMPADDFANRITSVFERGVTTIVNNIEHIESQTLNGVCVIKLFFHPGTDIPSSLAAVSAISQTSLRLLPPGTLPPLILNYDASTVPVMQLMLSSNLLSEQTMNDLGNNFIRTQLATVQGAALPYPYGGKVRQISVDINTKAMQTYGLSAQNINDAINNQSLIIPAGTEKIGAFEYVIKLNNSPLTIDEFNSLPVKASSNHVLYMRDVAHIRDGFSPQTNIVRVNGERAVMMSVEKTGNSSTLSIIQRVKSLLPIIKANLPDSLNLSIAGDQSLFVTAAIKSVVIEAITAGLLTGLMILIFLGSLRSTFIITLSIPLSMLASLSILSLLGQTINIMTLGGLALAVGILVDDATVAIENINWNLEQGKKIKDAILEGAQQIAIPAFVSTLCICIVFISMIFLTGVAKYLFIPFAEAVIFAMITSYLLSRTLIPTLAFYLLHDKEHDSPQKTSFLRRMHANFEKRFHAFKTSYQTRLSWTLQNNTFFMYWFFAFSIGSVLFIWPWLGSDFFPTIDAGEIKLHVSAPTGTRVEETARLADKIDALIRQVIPANELDTIVDNIGLPVSGINLTYSNSGTIGPQDADVLITLKKHHHPSAKYIHQLREQLKHAFPEVQFSFLPADIINQILNFGLPAVIDIQITGQKATLNHDYAQRLLNRIKHVPGIVDAGIKQANNYPAFLVSTLLSRAKELGFTQRDIATNLLISLSGSFQTTPNFWVDPATGVSYNITTQTPQYDMTSLQTLANIPITNLALSSPPQILGALADIKRISIPAVVSHYNVQPVVDIYASVEDRDLSSTIHDVTQMMNESKKELPQGSQLFMRGQAETQQTSFQALYLGLLFAILLIYLVIVINFQSWIDPFIIIAALPGALAGIAWMLFVTHTPLSVPALTGAIMCMGVATANSILIISFARQHLAEGHDPMTSALEAGVTRLRPVLMTALAMIIGMLPMALGLGEGSEQNAPLGRAVIGGLSFATIATLFFVPALFYKVYQRRNKGMQDA